MQRLTFRGQVQRKGFDPLIVPDQVWKIQKETEDVVRGMERVQAAELRNRQEYLASLKETQNLEESIREENFDLATEHAEAYRDAESQHYKTRLADVSEGGAYALENKLKADQRKRKKESWEKLKGLSATVLGQVQAWDEERGKKLLGYGTEIATRWGLTPEELKSFKFRGQNVKWADASMNRVIKRLKAQGASPEEINAVLGLSGRAMLGAQEAAMGVAGLQGWPNYFNDPDVRGKKVEEAGNLSWNDIEQDPDGIYSSEANIILRYHETEYLLKFKGIGQPGNGYDDQFLAAHLRPQMDKFSNLKRTEIKNRDAKAVEKRENKAFDDKVLGDIFAYGGDPGTVAQAIYDTIHSDSGEDPKELGKSRRRMYSALKRFAADGRFTYQMYEALDNLEYQQNGVGGEKKRWGDSYHREQGELKKILDDRISADWRARDNAEKNFGLQMHAQILRIGQQTGEPISEYELDNVQNEFTARGYKVPDYISSFMTREKMDDTFAEQDLAWKVAYGPGLRMSELYSGNYSKAVIAKYSKLTVESQGYDESLERDKRQAVKNAVAARLDSTILNSDQRTPQALLVGSLAVAEYNKKVNNMIISGKWNFDTQGDINVLRAEMADQVIDDINSGKLFPLATDPSGNVIRKGKDAGFAVLQGSFTYDKIGHESRAKAKENPAIVDTDADFLSDELHQKVIDMKPGDAYPHQLQVIKQAYPTQTYLQVINRARAAKKKASNGEGWDPLPPRGAHGLPLCVRPEIRSLMTHKPSLARTKVCLEEQAKLDKDETRSVTNFSRVNTKKDYVLAMGNPDDINGVRDGHGQVKPAEEMYNTKIEDQSWGEWENIVQRGGEKITYGEFDAQDIQWFEDSGLIDPNSAPDEATVNNLIAFKTDWQTTNFYAEGQKGKGLPNVGHSWHYEPEARTEKGQQDRLALALAGPFRIDRLVSGVLTA